MQFEKSKSNRLSQHVALAFIGATFLDHELGYISPWISVGGYVTASCVHYPGNVIVADIIDWGISIIYNLEINTSMNE